jgi:hypothetical protein
MRKPFSIAALALVAVLLVGTQPALAATLTRILGTSTPLCESLTTGLKPRH